MPGHNPARAHAQFRAARLTAVARQPPKSPPRSRHPASRIQLRSPLRRDGSAQPCRHRRFEAVFRQIDGEDYAIKFSDHINVLWRAPDKSLAIEIAPQGRAADRRPTPTKPRPRRWTTSQRLHRRDFESPADLQVQRLFCKCFFKYSPVCDCLFAAICSGVPSATR
jgi:hypothetical protein